jgi:SH3 domain-containing YSC84-like protein 1
VEVRHDIDPTIAERDIPMRIKIAVFVVLSAVLAAAESADKRLAQSTLVLHEMARASDKGIPQDLLEKAQCVVVVPGLKKIAFVGGSKYGRGFASCLTRKGWSPPAAVRIEGGSFGFQLGGSSTDVIMLVLNKGGMTKLMSDKFTLGGEAAAAAGPIGRNTSANTDVLMNAEILSWSRSRGLFAGISLEGATLRQDRDENANLYGKPLTNEQILTGTVHRPAIAHPFLAQLQRFSGKGVPPIVASKGRKGTSSDHGQPQSPTVNSDNSPNASPMGDNSAPKDKSDNAAKADNTANNDGDRAASAVTADQQKNNKSDVELAASIRRSIVDDHSLSTNAHNVKIIVENGAVILKGPVNSQDEKTAVAAKAAAIVGQDHVTDQTEVATQ